MPMMFSSVSRSTAPLPMSSAKVRFPADRIAHPVRAHGPQIDATREKRRVEVIGHAAEMCAQKGNVLARQIGAGDNAERSHLGFCLRPDPVEAPDRQPRDKVCPLRPDG